MWNPFRKAQSIAALGQLPSGSEQKLPQTFNDYASLYRDNPWVYACVFAIATAAAQVPWGIWPKGKTDDNDKIDDHPASDLFSRPNTDQGWFELIEQTVTYLELAGQEYWEIVAGAEGPAELLPLRPDRVIPVPAKDGRKIDHYDYWIDPLTRAGVKPDAVLQVGDVADFRYVSPLDDWIGQSSIRAGRDTVVLFEHMTRYAQKFFANDATPRTAITVNMTCGAQEAKTVIERLNLEWNAKFQGVENSNKPVFLPGTMTVTPLGGAPKDLEYMDGLRTMRDTILVLFGASLPVLGQVQDVKYENFRRAFQVFMRLTVKPKLLRIAGVINRKIMPLYDDGTELRFDFSEIDREDAQYEATVAKTEAETYDLYRRMGALNANEVRKSEDLGEPYADGEDFHTDATMTATTQTGPVSKALGELAKQLRE